MTTPARVEAPEHFEQRNVRVEPFNAKLTAPGRATQSSGSYEGASAIEQFEDVNSASIRYFGYLQSLTNPPINRTSTSLRSNLNLCK